MRQPTCEERIEENLNHQKSMYLKYMEWHQNNDARFDEGDEESYPFHQHYICLDYVEPDKTENLNIGFYRCVLSGGGPADDIRFFPNGKIEYWYMDWNDEASRNVTKESWARWLHDYFVEAGLIDWPSVKLYEY